MIKDIMIKLSCSHHGYFTDREPTLGGPKIKRRRQKNLSTPRHLHLHFIIFVALAELPLVSRSLLSVDVMISVTGMFNDIMYFCSTILYEIFTGKWPLNLPTHSVIWMIGKGQQECVTHIQCPESFKVRISYMVELGDAMASWLVRSSPDRAVRVRALARDIELRSWTRHLTLIVPLSTQVTV